MATKHFIKTEDFNKKDYLEIFRRARIFQDGIKKGKNFTSLCPGKVLATMFFQESTRTSASLQSAIIRLGGNYIGISGETGTYLASGEEDLEDFLNSFVAFSDIMAIRHKTLDLDKIASNFKIPLINAMCGKDEHTIGALAMLYTLTRRGFDLSKIKYGIYGMIKSSRPAKAVIKALSIFGATIYEDSVIDEFGTPFYIRKFVEKAKGRLIKKRHEEFLSEVDFLFITEGLPQAGEDTKLVKKYNQRFKIFTEKKLKTMKPNALMQYSMPAKLTDGRRIAEEKIDQDPRVITLDFMNDWSYAMMGLITYLLKIQVPNH